MDLDIKLPDADPQNQHQYQSFQVADTIPNQTMQLSESARQSYIDSLAQTADLSAIQNIINQYNNTATALTLTNDEAVMRTLSATSNPEKIANFIDTTLNIPRRAFTNQSWGESDNVHFYSHTENTTQPQNIRPHYASTLQQNIRPQIRHQQRPYTPTTTLKRPPPGLNATAPVRPSPFMSRHRPPLPPASMPATNPTAAPSIQFKSPNHPINDYSAAVKSQKTDAAQTTQQTPQTTQQQLTPTEITRKNRTQTIKYLGDHDINTPTKVKDLLTRQFNMTERDMLESVRQDYHNPRTYYITYKNADIREHVASRGYKLGRTTIPPEDGGVSCYIPDTPYWIDTNSILTLLRQYGTVTKHAWRQTDAGTITGAFTFSIKLTDHLLPETLTYCGELMHIKRTDTPLQCNYCKKYGHTTRKCRRKQEDQLPQQQQRRINTRDNIKITIDKLQQDAIESEHKYDNERATLTQDMQQTLKKHKYDATHQEIIDMQSTLDNIEHSRQKQIEKHEEDMEYETGRLLYTLDEIEKNKDALQNLDDKKASRREMHTTNDDTNETIQTLKEEITKLTSTNEQITKKNKVNDEKIQTLEEEHNKLRNAAKTQQTEHELQKQTNGHLTEQNAIITEKLDLYNTRLEQQKNKIKTNAANTNALHDQYKSEINRQKEEQANQHAELTNRLKHTHTQTKKNNYNNE